MKKSNTTTLFILATALVATLSTAVRAADAPQFHVKTADLDLSSPAGAAVLFKRITFAANQICGTADQLELSRLMVAKACAEKTVADTVHAVNIETLSAVYKAKTGNDATIKLASK